MPAAFIEHRPRSSDPNAGTSHYVIVANGKESGNYKTQKEAKDKACAAAYDAVHVTRVRHLQDRDPC